MPAVLMNWNRERDVATIGIASNSPAASPFTFTPDGSWAMTIGAPLDDVLVPVIGQVVHDDGQSASIGCLAAKQMRKVARMPDVEAGERLVRKDEARFPGEDTRHHRPRFFAAR